MSKYTVRIARDRAVAHKRILRYIRSHIRDYGEAPLIKEIANHMGVTNNAANRRIDQLIAIGCLAKSAGKRRGLYFPAPWSLCHVS